jgi:hypothetical protein
MRGVRDCPGDQARTIGDAWPLDPPLLEPNGYARPTHVYPAHATWHTRRQVHACHSTAWTQHPGLSAPRSRGVPPVPVLASRLEYEGVVRYDSAPV